jgi:formylglycine-generating enzyme required for sulfatase activity
MRPLACAVAAAALLCARAAAALSGGASCGCAAAANRDDVGTAAFSPPPPSSLHALAAAQRVNVSGAPMVCLPGGAFLFGNAFPEEGYAEEMAPARRVRVAAFAMDVTEVTHAQFSAFVAATGYITGAHACGCHTRSSRLSNLRA